MNSENNKEEKNPLVGHDGVIYLQGLIFIKKKVIKSNDEFVKKTFQDLYKHVSLN